MRDEAVRAVSSDAPDPSSRGAGEVHSRPLSQLLIELAADTSRECVSVADLLVDLQDRSLPALLLIFALPNVIPVPPGTSAVLGAPLLFLTAQLALGMRPWLPKVITQRSLSRSQFSALVTRVAPWLARAERLLRPRWGALCRRPADHVVGLVCLVLSLIMFLPIPLGNMLPALAICLMALGKLERDGVCVLAGLFAAGGSIALVSGVLYGAAKAAIFVIANAFS